VGVLDGHRNWRGDVAEVVQFFEQRYPRLRCRTYVCHPWCGPGPDGTPWDGHSIDFWWSPGDFRPLPLSVGRKIRKEAMNLSWGPLIRHTIWRHQLWTSYAGHLYWSDVDHVGKNRHLHITYW
jgi:hypothetical protein